MTIFSDETLDAVCASAKGTEEVEKMRLKLKKRKKNIVILSIVMVLAVAAIMFGGGDDYVGFAIILSIIIAGACLISLFHRKEKLLQLFREKIARHFVESLLQNGTYSPEKSHSLDEYYESLFYTTHVDRYYGANYTKGKYEKTDLSFSFMHTEYERVERTKNGTRIKRHTIFKGVFMCADCNKNFSATTVVLPDLAENTSADSANGYNKQRAILQDKWFTWKTPTLKKSSSSIRPTPWKRVI